MLYLFDKYAFLFQSWRVARYEQEGAAYLLHLSAVLIDDSRLEIRDYLFADGKRTYAYQWMEIDNRLRRRWDNAPHWPEISTNPHHCHIPGEDTPLPSTVANLESLFRFLQEWLDEDKP